MRPARASSFTLLLATATLLLGGCASRETVVLLPKADGSTGAIGASRGGRAEVVLDAPYEKAATGIGGRLKAGTSNPDAVRKRFGAALDAVPPAPQSYTVYFLTGGHEFSPESAATLATMLEAMAQRPEPEVSVVGHTDGTGNEADNDVLSLQRAERVKQMLVERGVSAERIDVAGRGWREPLVAAERGVDEPRNRRVEVSVR
jgi:outer membrane protein OmpA-like peptidoglycan-associated protein